MEKQPIIMIDPGHGGSAAGASYDMPGLDYDGLKEKDFALAVGLYLELMLANKQRHALLTRRDDRYVSLSDRVGQARAHQAGCFISIHADAYPDSPVEGYTVFYNPAGLALAKHINSTLAAFLPEERNRGSRPAKYYVLRNNDAPAVLVECGFVSTTSQRLWLMQPHVQYRFALAIAQGIDLFLNLKEGSWIS